MRLTDRLLGRLLGRAPKPERDPRDVVTDMQANVRWYYPSPDQPCRELLMWDDEARTRAFPRHMPPLA